MEDVPLFLPFGQSQYKCMFDAMEMDLIIQEMVGMNEKYNRKIDAFCILFHKEMIKRLVLT